MNRKVKTKKHFKVTNANVTIDKWRPYDVSTEDYKRSIKQC